MELLKKNHKIAVLGSGVIGSTLAYSLMLRCKNVEISLINRDERKAWIKAFDISHCESLFSNRSIKSVGINDCYGVDIIVITAGTLPNENGTRAEVLRANVEIFINLLPGLARNNPQAVFINVTNPVDAMAYAAYQITGFPKQRVIGTGTELDRMRLCTLIGREFHRSPDKFQIDILGEHGDTMLPVWSRACYDGRPIRDGIEDFNDEIRRDLLKKVIRAGWDIRQAGEHSCFAISLSTTRIIESMIGMSDRPVLVSSGLNGDYGIDGVYMSLPTRLGAGGVIERSSPDLTTDEHLALMASAEAVRTQMKAVDAIL
ncbi:MAG: hypothetical protein KBA26_14895 [Candidatus Delongbacteria bacterium]|nr:hypothetical protein [Candidatus Delongbacteria bacterium]